MVRLEKFLNGLTIHDVSCGYPAGSIFYLRFKGGMNSFRVDCSWRLDDSQRNITGWREGNDGPNSPLVFGLRQLIGATIIGLSQESGKLLVIRFDSGHVLYIFPDLTINYTAEGDSNWELNDVEHDTVYALNRDFSLQKLPYS